MMVATNNDEVHMATIKAIDENCANLKEFHAAGIFIRNEQFNERTLRPFFGRLEKITLQRGGFGGVNMFADCKKLKEWSQEIFYDFDGSSLNYDFPELRSIDFSKVAGIENEHMERFLSKNPQLKSLTLTRCTISPKILKSISKYVPNIEEIALNFRRSLIHRSDMQNNLKYLLELRHLKALNLDCVGVTMEDTLMKMAEKEIPSDRIGLFCCQWGSKLCNAFANMKHLKSVHLSNISGLNDECLRHLSENLIGLTELTLKFIETITLDGVIKLITQCQLLTTVNFGLEKLTTLSTDRYNMLIEAIKNRPEKSKVTMTLWGSTNPLKIQNDFLKQNLELLEIVLMRGELNKDTDFDFYCDTADGGYDVFVAPSSRGCCIIN